MTMRLRVLSIGVGAAAVLTGCTGVQLQESAARFDQGVHTVDTAEMSLFHEVQAAECNRNFYARGFAFATAARDPMTHAYPPGASILDLSPGDCTNTELTDAEVAIRQKLMESLTLYADAIQSMTAEKPGVSLDDASKSEAANIKALATQEKFGHPQSTAVAALNSAVMTLATATLDRSAYQHINEAARAVQGPLAVIVDELKGENTADVAALQSKADGLANELRAALSAARDQTGPASFLDVLQARAALISVTIKPPDVVQLNTSLDAIVKANDALARNSHGGAVSEISDLTSRAEKAATLFNAAK